MDTKNSDKLFSFLKTLHLKYTDLTRQVSSSEIINNKYKLRDLSKEIAYLEPVNEKYLKYSLLKNELTDTHELIDLADDQEMKELAAEEISKLKDEIKQIELDIKALLATDQVDDARNVFLEIRAGAGGNEASLFASDLLRMYSRIAERNHWKFELISTNYSGIGGIKEIILYIKGVNANKHLKFESGVHRVQRVPETESSGRIHTSTVTVAVIPEIEDIKINIDPKDIRIDTFASSAPGGQHVNKTQSAIRITHFPTGLVVSCQDEKSQHKNKSKALKVLRSRIYAFEKTKQEDTIASDRKAQVGSGDRSEKIRTYNYPQNRVTDHRVKSKNFNIETILDGNTQELFSLLTKVNAEIVLEEKLKSIIG